MTALAVRIVAVVWSAALLGSCADGNPQGDSATAEVTIPSGCYQFEGAVGFPPRTADLYVAERVELRPRRSQADGHVYGLDARILDPPLNWTRTEGEGVLMEPDSVILQLAGVTYRLRTLDSMHMAGIAMLDAGPDVPVQVFGPVDGSAYDCPS
jgi:hypothetical protein